MGTPSSVCTPTIPHALVIDSGAGVMKAGFAGDAEPRIREACVVARKPHIIGKSPASATHFGNKANQWYWHDAEVERIMPHPRYTHSITAGNVLEMYRILDFLLESLNVGDAENLLLVMTTSSTGDDPFIRQGLDWAFDKHKFKAIAFVHEGYAALRSYDMQCGIVLDVGECDTRVIPVISKHGVDIASMRHSMLSGYLSNLFLKELLRCNNFPSLSLDLAVVDEIKRNISYISTDASDYKKIDFEKNKQTVDLPKCYGDVKLNITIERYLVSELFFNPHLMMHILPGRALAHGGEAISEIVVDSWVACPLDERSEIQQLVAVGGTCNTPNFLRRLQKEIDKEMLKRFPKRSEDSNSFTIVDLNGKVTKDRGNLVFRGASIIAKEILRQPSSWISRDEYASNRTSAIKKANWNAIKCQSVT